MKTLLLISILTMAVSASAIVDPDPDGVGIYFDTTADQTTITTSVPFKLVTAYLIATNISVPSGISRWQASLRHEGEVVERDGWIFEGNQYDPDPDDYLVTPGVLNPLPWSEAIILATWQGYVWFPVSRITFYIGARGGSPALPDTPGYSAGDDLTDIHILNVSSGIEFDRPVAVINPGDMDVVENDSATMSRLKTLYR